jgi:hypothetical protein
MVQTLRLEAFSLHMVAQVEQVTLLLLMEDVERVAEYSSQIYWEVVERRVVMAVEILALVEVLDQVAVASAEMAVTTHPCQHLEMEVSGLHLCLDQRPIA